MKKIIFVLFIGILFSCKNKEEVKPSHELKVIYKSEDPTGMNIFLTTTNEWYFNEHKDTSDFVFTKSIETGQNIQGSITSPSGYWKTLIVIFNSDTLYNAKKGSNHSFNIDI